MACRKSATRLPQLLDDGGVRREGLPLVVVGLDGRHQQDDPVLAVCLDELVARLDGALDEHELGTHLAVPLVLVARGLGRPHADRLHLEGVADLGLTDDGRLDLGDRRHAEPHLDGGSRLDDRLLVVGVVQLDVTADVLAVHRRGKHKAGPDMHCDTVDTPDVVQLDRQAGRSGGGRDRQLGANSRLAGQLRENRVDRRRAVRDSATRRPAVGGLVENTIEILLGRVGRTGHESRRVDRLGNVLASGDVGGAVDRGAVDLQLVGVPTRVERRIDVRTDDGHVLVAEDGRHVCRRTHDRQRRRGELRVIGSIPDRQTEGRVARLRCKRPRDVLERLRERDRGGLGSDATRAVALRDVVDRLRGGVAVDSPESSAGTAGLTARVGLDRVAVEGEPLVVVDLAGVSVLDDPLVGDVALVASELPATTALTAGREHDRIREVEVATGVLHRLVDDVEVRSGVVDDGLDTRTHATRDRVGHRDITGCCTGGGANPHHDAERDGGCRQPCDDSPIHDEPPPIK